MATSTEHDAHYLAIGKMLVLFQSLEATLKDGLVLLVNNQIGTPGGQLAYATISQLSFRAATLLASALPATFTVERIGAKDGESSKRLEQALTEAEGQLKEGIKLAAEVEQRRNQLVHSRWFISPEIVSTPGRMTRTKTKTKAGSMSIELAIESIADIDANTEKERKAQALIGSALRDYQRIAQHVW